MAGYDYSQTGIYFVTICVENRLLLLEPQPVREMIERWWAELRHKFPTVELDAFVVMPNHVHGLVGIVAPEPETHSRDADAASEVSLPAVIHWFKTMTTNVTFAV